MVPETDTQGRNDELSQSGLDLRNDLGKRDLARHLAFFFQSKTVQLETVAVYLSHGLQTDHRCLYLADVNTPEQIEEGLRAANVDVAEHVEAGDLVIRDASDVYLDAGFDPDRMIETLDEACQDSLSAGYEGLWMAGENTWCFHTAKSFDQILDFEADFDATCPDLPLTALCQYDLTEFSGESAAKALWTHRQIIYRNAICDNPFYIPPEEYRTTADPHLNAQLMLEQTYNLAHARQQVERREQRLTVVNRTLRHNIRNDLNVVQAALELLGKTEVDPTVETRREVALDHVENVLEMSEKARYVQQTISDPGIERVSLATVIGHALADVRASHPESDISVSGERELTVLADPNLDIAVSEALTWAIRNRDRDSSSVTLAVSAPSANTARIEVSYSGTVPDIERQTLQRGYETQLEHARGLGLWLIIWIVENSNGTVEFPETAAGEATIRIDLHRVRD